MLTTGLLHLMTLMRAQLAVNNNLLCFLCALRSVKREKECQQSPSTHDKRHKPFNSRDTCTSLARKIISKRKNDVIGENNLEPNTNCYHNVYSSHIVLRGGFNRKMPRRRDPLYGAE